jgi:hypothetical protein
MSTDAVERPLTPNIFARLAKATRYAITGASPDAWFGPQQPLAPVAPPEVKGRQFDYAFGANLNYNPRSEGGVSFAELRALADARCPIVLTFMTSNFVCSSEWILWPRVLIEPSILIHASPKPNFRGPELPAFVSASR